ncbi:TerB family tellurite resistance protein [Emcibacter sp. SYSU 3D8]|uniref:tellurite resistance TerB family protein n=1 Tax=Emcibacter sp. SYSU 3D8 TaxID=3133969 RepID=UPI0031FEDF84
MLEALKALLGAGAPPVEREGEGADIHIAAAVLMVDAASIDGEFGDNERGIVAGILKRHFGLTDDALANLMSLAVGRRDTASDLNRYTLTIKDEFSEAQRVELVELLWEVVYADGQLHAYEANLLRRIAGLLYVSDRERGDARKRVLNRLGVTE